MAETAMQSETPAPEDAPQGGTEWDAAVRKLTEERPAIICRRNPPYVRFTKQEMEDARDVPITELAEALGYTVKQVGARYHSTLEADSLMIKDDRTWKRYSNGKHGDSITFVQVFMKKSFPEAVKFLLAFSGKARDSPDRADAPPRPAKKREPPKQTPFSLPIAWTDNRCVNRYLRERGIAQQVIDSFIRSGLLYEDLFHNCCFIGKNAEGKPVFASKRGTSDWHGKPFKCDAAGSDKSVAFRLPCDPEVNWVCVFEAPIDLMSFCTLNRSVRSNAVALCGLAERPLDTYLKENPTLKRVVLCLDADEPGQEATQRLMKKYKGQGYAVSVRVPPKGKDWNEYIQLQAQERQQNRRRAAAL